MRFGKAAGLTWWPAGSCKLPSRQRIREEFMDTTAGCFKGPEMQGNDYAKGDWYPGQTTEACGTGLRRRGSACAMARSI